MNAKFLRRLRILLAIVSITFLMLSIFARFTEMEFLSVFNQWLLTKFDVLNVSFAYLYIAIFLGVLSSLVQHFELKLQNKVNKSV